MILADTSVWIDHLRRRDSTLVGLLERDEIGVHPLVVEELALGSIKDRAPVLAALASLHRFPAASHAEVLELIEVRRLWSRGLGAVDLHLLAAGLLQPAGRLWTRDRRLRSAALDAGVAHEG